VRVGVDWSGLWVGVGVVACLAAAGGILVWTLSQPPDLRRDRTILIALALAWLAAIAVDAIARLGHRG
jgi:hypothetical protein